MYDWSEAKGYEAFTAYVNEGIERLNAERTAFEKPLLPFTLNQVYAISKRIGELYTSFEIPKKSGSMRQIDAPTFQLKLIQRAIKAMLETEFEASSAAHGFIRDRNIQSNAAVHVGQDWVLNLDVEGFFPSIHKGRIKVILKREPIAYSPDLAAFIATICTKDGVLPQGSPASPLLTNLACVRLDRKLKLVAEQFGAQYTRYADDITFSGPGKAMLTRLLTVAERVLKSEGLKVHPTKTRLLPSSQRQEVTGLTTNEVVNAPRAYRRRVRAALHQWETAGHIFTANKYGYSTPEKFVNSLGGQIEFILYSAGKAQSSAGLQNDKVALQLKEKFNQLVDRL